MKIAIIIPFIDNELNKFFESLITSLNIIISGCQDIDLNIIFVPQTYSTEISSPFVSEFIKLCNQKFRSKSVDINSISLEKCSVSRARNVGIEFAIVSRCSHIFFHDISICVTNYFVQSISGMRNTASRACYGKPIFADQQPSEIVKSWEGGVDAPRFKESICYPVLNPYLWTYLLPLSLISCTRFDERIGPGESTSIKAGEDSIFLSEVLSKCKFRVMRIVPSAVVYHPPREIFDEKNLTYAMGQGFAYKTIFLKHKRLFDLIYIFLFLGNALKKAIFGKRQSFEILSDRIKGLFLSDNNL